MINHRVSLKDVYNIVEKTGDRNHQELKDFRKEINGSLKSMGIRVTALEHWKISVTTRLALIFAAITLVFNLSVEYFKEKIWPR